MYTHDLGLTFLAHERTATRATRDAFINAGGKQVAPHHEGPRQGHEVFATPFTVVRNHWDLIVSHWYNAAMHLRRDPPITQAWLIYHFMSNRYLFPAGGMYRFLEVPNIRILRYETLQEDLDELFSEFGLELQDLKMVGQSAERAGSHYSNYFDRESAGFVAWAFRKEIEELGYTFEIPRGKEEKE